MSRLLALAVSLASVTAWAEAPVDCRAEAFRVFPPPGATVPPNVEFRMFARPSASVLAGVMLKSTLTDLIPTSIPRTALVIPRGATVTVRRVGAAMSPVDEQVALLKPETPVPPGPHRFQTLPIRTSFFEFLKDASWTIDGEADRTPPVFATTTVTAAWCEGKKKQRRCVVQFAQAVAEPVVVALELSGKGRRLSLQWPAEPSVPLRLDLGPCGGMARDLVPGRYKASLRTIDFGGNSSPSVTFDLVLADRPPAPGK